MTADYARKLVKEKELEGIEDIYADIKKEALKQHYVLYWYSEISSAIKKKLESDGFDVRYLDSYRIKYYYMISWKE